MWRWKEKHLHVHCKQQKTNPDIQENNSALLPSLLFLNQQISSMPFYRKMRNIYISENYNLKWNSLGTDLRSHWSQTLKVAAFGKYLAMPLVPLSILGYYWFLEVKYFWQILNPFFNLPLPSVGGFLTAESRGKTDGLLPSQSVYSLKLCLGCWQNLSFYCRLSLRIPDST